MMLSSFNNLDKETAAKELFTCCGSQKWVSLMMSAFPFESEEVLVEKATTVWYNECGREDWAESFAHHPKIGDKKSLSEKFAGKEQERVVSATEEVINALAKANIDYEKKFGFIFIVCATGKSAPEMLRLLGDRLKNDSTAELNIAMGEQHKITLIRVKKLIDNANFQFLKMSQITTHVLDTSSGNPGNDISIRLMQKGNDTWNTIAQGITNSDGRIADLIPPGKTLSPGTYKMVFETGDYYAVRKIKTFYPAVVIQFTVFDNSHYHVPLLISPFGYSTYRGS
jgi:5-hydroxyisourate hydrolase/2-oxo-4-hydroxy-4-carboxy-5-ureidoimidazoline decarboxylase